MEGFMKLTYFVCLFSCLITTFVALSAQAQTETVLYSFPQGGGIPASALTSDGKGNFYGTTVSGGLKNGGSVFELSPNDNGGWNEATLYSFCSAPNCEDGESPKYSYVIFDGMGNLYGTANLGGGTTCLSANGCGVVFELSPEGTGWKETVIYRFQGEGDGANPVNGLVMDTAGNLFGTSYNPNNLKPKNVFELSPTSGGWTEKVIYSAGKGYAGLTMDDTGNIFGSASSTVFELSPNGNGGWNPAVIYTFPGAPKDGKDAEGTLVFDKMGNLYGTTTGGGIGLGTVFELSPLENGEWAEEILYSLKGGKTDGKDPFSGIAFDSYGNIYGTTFSGGESDEGTVFELLAPVGAGSYSEKVLWSFDGADGAYPYAGVTVDGARNLYGTAYSGGLNDAGVVFEVTPLPGVTTATTLKSSPNPSSYGQTVNFVATVASNFGTPPNVETISFMDGKTVLGMGMLSGGSASFPTSTLKVGTNSITAVYAGDSNFAASTSKALSQVVSKATTITTLASSLNPSSVGQSVTFTASVAPEFSGTATGNVTFYDGTTLLKTVAVNKDVAKYITKTLTSGTHTITATYSGSTSFDGSSSAPLTQTVNWGLAKLPSCGDFGDFQSPAHKGEIRNRILCGFLCLFSGFGRWSMTIPFETTDHDRK
jgi:uncharacterized repeat protein (TIGR03803 family)